MKIRPLTESEVTFTVRIEPEELPVRGAFSSGDPDYEAEDKETEDKIIERLNQGDEKAWCTVVVTANWKGTYCSDTLGACSLTDEYTAEVVASEHGMKAEALARLNGVIAEHAKRYAELMVDDTPADTRSMRDLANEAIRVQDACNLSGVAHAFSRTLPRLRAVLAERLGTGPSTIDVNTHPVTQAWVDKLASLAGVQALSGTGCDNAAKAHDECLDLAANARY